MPPKKQPVQKDKAPETPKKDKGGISKRTSAKGTPTKAAGSTAERDLLFFWNATRLSGGIAFNTEAVAKEYGMTNGAVNKRWYRLKKKIELAEAAKVAKGNAMEEAVKSDEKDIKEEDTDEEDIDESD